MSSKKLSVFITLVFIAFFVRAIPHLFLIPKWCPADEQTNYATIKSLVETGKPININFYPHGTHYFIYGLWFISRIDPVALSQYANPLIGALTLIPLYFLLKKYGEKQAFIGCLLFALAEAHIYRSSYFGTTEPLAFLLGLTALTLYLYKFTYLPILFLVSAYFTHLLPTVFFVLVLLTISFYESYRKFSLYLLVTLSGALYTLFFNPHKGNPILSSSMISLTSLTTQGVSVYSFNDLLFGILVFSSVSGLLSILITSFFLKKLRFNLSTFIFVTLSFIFVIGSWLSYSTTAIAPPRVLMYFQTGLILLYISNIKKLDFMTTFQVTVLILLSLTSLTYGFQKFLWVQDSLTFEEFEAIDWAEHNGLINANLSWWGDAPVMNEIASRNKGVFLKTYSPYEKQVQSTRRAYEFEKYEKYFQIALYSTRIQKRAFFRIIGGINGIRTLEIREPTPNYFETRPYWGRIHDKNGVRIYLKYGVPET